MDNKTYLTPKEAERLQPQALRAYKILVEELKRDSIEFCLARAEIFPLKTVGVKGDKRVYQHLAIISVMGRDREAWSPDYNLLERVSTRIVNQCEDITRVAYFVEGREVLDTFIQEWEETKNLGFDRPLTQL